jgi:alpha-glucosidase
MFRYFLTIYSLLFTGFACAQAVNSPDKRIKLEFSVSGGTPVYTVYFNGEKVLDRSALGIDMGGTDLHDKLKLVKVSPVSLVKDTYTMVNAKKESITYTANKREFDLVNKQGRSIGIVFQVANDGVAFRYRFAGMDGVLTTINKEYTSYHFLPSAKAWLQPKAVAQTGWEHTNPSYEENYRQHVDVGAKSVTGWVYPALFRSANTWIAVTEAGMDGSYCGTVLKNEPESSVYQVSFPDVREVFTGKGSLPQSAGNWHSPWRLIAIGSLKTIMESTMGTDLAIPAIKLKDPGFIKPGKSSWSWIMSKDEAIVYAEQQRYIDYAASMKWQYCLIDVNWDTKIGYDKIAELAAYGAAKNVGLLLWYNSAGSWNTVPYHPKDKLLTRQSRRHEFERLNKMGIKGIKVDFFNGDGQSMIAYYTDILTDAADYNLLVNFHGATLPRGWARTYPHLMTTEAVKGFEMVTFTQQAADEEANHAAMLPFTRNLFDPMDFTPMNLYKIPTSVIRKTTSAFELATGVLFLSGIQHYAESPDGMAKMPDFIKDYLRDLPDHWQDVKFIDGEPGNFVVIARRSGDKWYVAGINGTPSAKKLSLDLAELNKQKGTLLADGPENLNLQQMTIALTPDKKVELTLKGNGGFVIILE